MFASTITELKQQPWLWRYLLAEAVALTVALASIMLASCLTDNRFILVAASVYSGSVGYYSVLLIATLSAEWRDQRTGRNSCWCSGLVRTARTLLLALGSAELLDSLLVSPLLLYLCLHLLPNHQLAVLLSELVSTLVFYAIVFMVQRIRQTEEAQLYGYGWLCNKQRKSDNEKVSTLSEHYPVVDLGRAVVCPRLCGAAARLTARQRSASREY